MYFEEASFTLKSTVKGYVSIILPPLKNFGSMIGNYSQPLILQAGLLAIIYTTTNPLSIYILFFSSVKSVTLPSYKLFRFKEVFIYLPLSTN